MPRRVRACTSEGISNWIPPSAPNPQDTGQSGDAGFISSRTAVSLAASFSELTLQPLTEQNPWKLSYWIQSLNPTDVIERLTSQLNQWGLLAQIILSSNRDLDILPCPAGKGNALTYLRQRFAIEPELTLACGDSGNDMALFEQRTLGVIVQNAQPELLAWYELHPSSRCYVAKSSYAAAIQEGLIHFKLLA